MKALKIFAAAGLTVATFAGAGSASAQSWHHDRYERERYEHRYDRDRYDHRRDRHRGWDRGRHYGWHRGYRGRACRIEWRHHHRVRVCYPR